MREFFGETSKEPKHEGLGQHWGFSPFLRCLFPLLFVFINVIFQEVQVFIVVSFTHVIFLYKYAQSILS